VAFWNVFGSAGRKKNEMVTGVWQLKVEFEA